MRRRRFRIRKKITGTGERPRMSVRFTEKNVYVQFIDDSVGLTMAAVSSLTHRAKKWRRTGRIWVTPARLGKPTTNLSLAHKVPDHQ